MCEIDGKRGANIPDIERLRMLPILGSDCPLLFVWRDFLARC